MPRRGPALLAKAAVVALLALVIGEVSAFGSWFVATLLQPRADLALNSGADWITVAGKFLTGTGASNARAHGAGPVSLSTSPLAQGWALAYFAAVAFALLAFAITVAKNRDA